MLDFGNTSAYAEKTLVFMFYSLMISKHLRVRGENRITLDLYADDKETPPRTRRKPTTKTQNLHGIRNTSAYAEKTHCLRESA